MAADRYLIERLPFYLNGTLDEEESAEVGRLLAESPEARRELELTRAAARIYGHQLPTDVIVDYAFEGDHADIPSDLMERYLAVSPIARDELEMIRQSKAALESETSASQSPAGVLAFDRRTVLEPATGWRRMALAASIVGVAALGAVGWQAIQMRESRDLLARTENQLRDALALEARPGSDPAENRVEELEQENSLLAAGKSDLVGQLEQRDARIEQLGERIAELSEPLLNIPVVDVLPGDMVLRGEPAADRAVIVPRQTRSVALILNSNTGRDESVSGMRILAADGAEVWRSTDSPQRDDLDTFTVSLPVQELEVGRYTLQLIDESEGRVEVVETYQLELR